MASSNAAVNGQHTAKPPAVEPLLLPSAQSEDVVLVPANALEHSQTGRLNADEWRGPISLEQYLERERCLLRQDLTKDNRLTGWLLTSTKLPLNDDGTRPILACCETILTDAYVARDGKLQAVLAHGICSVFTRPEHRGKGYAGRMMAELGKRLETWQQADSTKTSFSVLYSDIGKKFYSRFGWKVFPSTHIHLAPMSLQDYESASQALPAVEDLSAKDLKDLPTTAYVEQALLSMSEQRKGTPIVAIRPDTQHFSWHHAREDFVTKALGKDVPQVKGAIHKQTGVALIWVRVYSSNQEDWQMNILHAVIPPAVQNSVDGLKALSALLLRAQLEAHTWNMAGGVEVWDPSELIIAAAQSLRVDAHDKVEVINRDTDHICSLRWNGSGTEASDEVHWTHNEKYAWC